MGPCDNKILWKRTHSERIFHQNRWFACGMFTKSFLKKIWNHDRTSEEQINVNRAESLIYQEIKIFFCKTYGKILLNLFFLRSIIIDGQPFYMSKSNGKSLSINLDCIVRLSLRNNVFHVNHILQYNRFSIFTHPLWNFAYSFRRASFHSV